MREPRFDQELRAGGLAPDGIIVVPLWLRAGVQASIHRDGSDLVSIDVTPCGFMRLRGPHAGPETYFPLDGWVPCDDAIDPSRQDTADGCSNLLRRARRLRTSRAGGSRESRCPTSTDPDVDDAGALA
jgi:hypothetical protein